MRRSVAQIYVDTTKQPIEKILADIERDRYLTAEEAKAYGLIDRIIDSAVRTPPKP